MLMNNKTRNRKQKVYQGREERNDPIKEEGKEEKKKNKRPKLGGQKAQLRRKKQ